MVHRFVREQLYELVWREPISKLAKRLGVSDVGLAKACRRAIIPLPGIGHWAKVQHGKKVKRVASLKDEGWTFRLSRNFAPTLS
jgi:hypothetical protein